MVRVSRGDAEQNRLAGVAGRRAGKPMAQVDWAATLTIQLMPNRSTHMPNVSPQGAFSNGIVTVLPSLRRSQ